MTAADSFKAEQMTYAKPWVIWVALVLGIFAANRLGKVPVGPGPVIPTPTVDALSPAMQAFKKAVGPVSASDKKALSEYYTGLARAVEADPPADPVFPTTEKLRAGHRAGLLVLWRGFLGNSVGEYAGLKEAIEGALTEAVGATDVPLNPAIRQKAVACFKDMAACTSAKP